MNTLLTVTILLSVIKYVSGLKCIDCLHLEYNYLQNNGSNPIYRILDLYRNPECLSENPLQYSNTLQQSSVGETLCSGVVNQPNSVQKCGYMYGEVTIFITTIQRAVKFTFYERNCFQVPKTLEYRCYARKRLAEDINYMYIRLNSLFGRFRVDNFDGNLCLCSSSLCCFIVTLIIYLFLCFSFLQTRFG
ncbi:hypothetical protein ACJMK2_034730 [Sinanodonta woodiana]|uniref:Uncharacterized protein n=1 Tax=Sinanodonta woodiana TaxID=1069815 RepID=A0ABD3WW02_SINWO